MQLLINHLTRMQPGWICAAGIDLASGRHIRPVAGHGLPNSLLHRNGGPLALGVVVDLGPSEFCGTVPEIEDRRFDIENLSAVEQYSPMKLHQACQQVAAGSLRNIFSDDLEWLHHQPSVRKENSGWGATDCWGTAAVMQHRGIRSLGCYWACESQLLIVDKEKRRRVRMRFREGKLAFDVPVTDYRLYLADQVTPDEAAVQMLASRITRQAPTLVAIGLSRAYRHSETQPARHWLQINNVLLTNSVGLPQGQLT